MTKGTKPKIDQAVFFPLRHSALGESVILELQGNSGLLADVVKCHFQLTLGI